MFKIISTMRNSIGMWRNDLKNWNTLAEFKTMREAEKGLIYYMKTDPNDGTGRQKYIYRILET